MESLQIRFELIYFWLTAKRFTLSYYRHRSGLTGIEPISLGRQPIAMPN